MTLNEEEALRHIQNCLAYVSSLVALKGDGLTKLDQIIANNLEESLSEIDRLLKSEYL